MLHVPALSRVPGVVVAALADPDAARLSGLASRCRGARTYADYRALLDERGIDLVAVCVPATLHAEVAVAGLRAGKHVFIEKPLAVSLDDCDRIVAEAVRADAVGVRSAVGFNLRSHRLLRRAKSIVESGVLGEIELLRTLWTADWTGAQRPAWHALRTEGGGALLEIGTHLADLWRWLLSSEVRTVRALSRSVAFDDQTVGLQARMESGAVVSAAVSQRTTSHNVVEIFGDRGSLRLSSYHADSLEVALAGASSRGAWRRIRPLLVRASQLPAVVRAARHGGDFSLSYVHQWRHIAAAVRNGESMPATVHDGRQAALVLGAAVRSATDDTELPLARTPLEPEARAG